MMHSLSRWPLAAIHLPRENPLKEMTAGLAEIPWLQGLGDGDAEGHPNKRRLLTVSEFFQYTEQQGVFLFLVWLRADDHAPALSVHVPWAWPRVGSPEWAQPHYRQSSSPHALNPRHNEQCVDVWLGDTGKH